MDKNLKNINEILVRVSSSCRKAYMFFTVILVAYCAMGTLFFISALLSDGQDSVTSTVMTIPFYTDGLFTPLGVIEMLSLLLSLVITGFALFVLRSIFKDIAMGRSPFTFAHATQIKVVAWLLVADAAIGLVLSPGFFTAFNLGGSLEVGYASAGDFNPAVLPLDAKGIAGAIFCFALSLIWRYGALLQCEEDDLM